MVTLDFETLHHKKNRLKLSQKILGIYFNLLNVVDFSISPTFKDIPFDYCF